MVLRRANDLDYENRIGADVIALAVWMFHGFCELDKVFLSTSFVKMVCFAVMFLYFLLTKEKVVLSTRYFLVYVFFVLYYVFDAMVHLDIKSGISDGFQVMSWWLILLFSMLREHSNREINLLFNAIKYACLISSITLLVKNDWLSSKIMYTLWEGISINRNYIADFTTPGLLVVILQLVKNKKSILNWCILVIFVFTCLQPNSRTMFVIMISMIAILLLWYAQKVQTKRMVRVFLFVFLAAVIGVFLAYIFLPESYISRLWAPDAYTLQTSSRWDLWVRAVRQVTNPVFGMGAGYNQETIVTGYGAHNMFVDLFCDAGLVAIAFAVYICKFFIRKDFVTLFMLIIPVSRSVLESGRSISVWAVLVLLAMMLVKSDLNDSSVESVILDL